MTGETIPKTQLAALAHAKGQDTVLEEIPVPQESELEPGRCLVKILYSGVCHSDLSVVDDGWAVKAARPCLLGHEGAGVLVAINDPMSKFKVGDRVGVKYVVNSCNQCTFCLEGDEALCPEKKVSMFDEPGTFQQYCATYTSQLTKIPDNLPLQEAAPILCAGVTVWRALKNSRARPGNWIVIPGAGGGLGALAVQYAKYMGLNVIAIDTGDAKKQFCLEVGARHFIDFKETKDLVADIQAATPDGFGPHVAIVTSPRTEAYQVALQYVRPKGTVVAVGLPSDGDIMPVHLLGTILNNKTFTSSVVGSRLDTIEALDIVADGHVKCPIRVEPFKNINKVYEQMRAGQITGRVVLDLFA